MLSEKLINQYANHCFYVKENERRTVEEYKNDLLLLYYYICREKYGDGATFKEDVELDNNIVADYIAYCKKKKISDYTINRKISAINGYLSYCGKRWGMPYEKVGTVVGKRKTQYSYLKKAEQDILISGLGQKHYYRNKAIILLILNTGIKVSTLHSLNISEDILENIVVDGKAIPVPQVVRKALEEYIAFERRLADEEGKKKQLFISAKGTRLTARSIERMLKKASECSGLYKDITPESLRQTYIAGLAMKGMKEDDIKERLNLKEHLYLERFTYL